MPPAETGSFGGKNSQILWVGLGKERVQAGICTGPLPEGDAPGVKECRGVKEEMKLEEMKLEEMRSAEHTWMCLPTRGVMCLGMTWG